VKHTFKKKEIKSNFQLAYRKSEKERALGLHPCSMGRGEVPAWVFCTACARMCACLQLEGAEGTVL